jgi:hypothetical protein
VPQLSWLALVSAHAPLQLVSFGPHCATHAPRSQTWPFVHAFAQLPQCAGSALSSTHAPLHTTLPFGQLVVHWPPVHTSEEAHAWAHDPQFS